MGETRSYNSVQKIPEVPITPRRVVVQPRTWYTCPAGKKAIVKGSIQCTSRGAAATSDFKAAGEIMFRYDRASALVGPYTEFPRTLTTANGGQLAFFDVELEAGEIIETVQDSGTNAEWNIFADVKETPI